MKKLFRFIILILVIVTGVVGYLAFQDNVKIPNSMVKGAVMTKFPIEKSYPGGKIKLYNPKTKKSFYFYYFCNICLTTVQIKFI